MTDETYLSNDLYKCYDMKIQNTEQTENQRKCRKSSFAKQWVEFADLSKPVLNKMMTIHI